MSTLTKEQETIERLLPDIRATHKEFLKSGQTTVDLARQLGDMLWKLRECVKKGEWTALVEDRCELPMRTAQTYMKISGGWKLLENKEAAATTIDGCVKLIGQSKPKAHKGGKAPSKRKTTTSADDNGESQENSAPPLGKCPNCGGKKWKHDNFGCVVCAKCSQPHGEPAGNADEDKAGIQRSKTVKTVEALMRAFDDLNRMVPKKDEHVEAIASCKFLLKTARAWK